MSVLPSSLLSRETEGEDEKPFWHPRHPGDHIGPHHSKSAHPGKGGGGGSDGEVTDCCVSVWSDC